MKKNIYIIILGFANSILALNAQTPSLSPYSSYNIGLNESYTTTLQKITGSQYSFINNDQQNPSNPCANAFLSNTQLDLGLKSDVRFINENSITGTNQITNFAYGSLAIPIKDNNWGFSLSLHPYSKVQYNTVFTAKDIDNNTYTNTLNGSGGLNMVKLSSGKSFKADSTLLFSVGASYEYLFGEIVKNKDVFSSDVNTYRIARNQISDLKGRGYEASFLVSKIFSKKHKINFTTVYGSSKKMSNNFNDFTYSYQTSNKVIIDTIQYVSETLKKEIPMFLGFGLSYNLKNKDTQRDKFIWFADYEIQKWNASSLNIDGSELTTQNQYATGIQYYWHKRNKLGETSTFIFCTGFKMINYPVIINSTQLKSNALSVGISLPVTAKSKTNTRINFGTEVGNFNNIAGTNYKESFARIYFGVTLTPTIYDKWFQRVQID